MALGEVGVNLSTREQRDWPPALHMSATTLAFNCGPSISSKYCSRLHHSTGEKRERGGNERERKERGRREATGEKRVRVHISCSGRFSLTDGGQPLSGDSTSPDRETEEAGPAVSNDCQAFTSKPLLVGAEG